LRGHIGAEKRALGHGEGASAHAEADASGAEVTAVAAPAVDLAVGGVVLVGGVQRPLAVRAAETPSVPDAVLADHLLGGVDGVAATTTALSGGGSGAAAGGHVVMDDGRDGSIGADQSRSVSETESFGSEQFAIAGPAVDLLVGTVASQHRIQRTMALCAVEALLVPHGSFSQLLFSGEDHSSAPGTALTRWGLDRGRIGVVEGSRTGDLIFGQPIGLQEARTASEAVAVGAPLLSVACLAVNIAVGTVACNDGIQGLPAVLALEALAMPWTTFGQDLLGGEYYATATGTTLTCGGLDNGSVDDRSLGGLVTVGVAIALKGATALAVTISLRSKPLSVTYFAVNFLVGALSDIHRVQSLGAITTLETGLVEGPASGQHLFGGIDVASTSWASFTFGGLRYGLR